MVKIRTLWKCFREGQTGQLTISNTISQRSSKGVEMTYRALHSFDKLWIKIRAFEF